jgi:hypothetical protein
MIMVIDTNSAVQLVVNYWLAEKACHGLSASSYIGDKEGAA